LAKIAGGLHEVRSAHEPRGSARPDVRLLASGDGWSVKEAVCDRGPFDRPFEDQHERVTIAMVAAGTFQYRGLGLEPAAR
jgi:AraC family transcriptional regulator